MAAETARRPYVHVPVTVSVQAQEFLATLKDPALMPAYPEPDDLAGWEKVRAHAEADGKAKSAPLLQPTIGGGSPSDVLFVGIILSIALIPFFAFREIGRVIGERELHALLFHKREAAAAHP